MITDICKNQLEQMVTDSGTGVTFEINNYLRKSTGRYEVKKRHIRMNSERICKLANSLNEESGLSISADTMAAIVLAHELGHAADPNVQVSCNKRRIYFEQAKRRLFLRDKTSVKGVFQLWSDTLMKEERTAWSLASRFYPPNIEQAHIDAASSRALKSYKRGIRRRYRLFLLSMKLLPFLQQLEGAFFPAHYSYEFHFSKADHFSVSHEQKKIYFPVAEHYASIIKRPCQVKSLPYVLFRIMLDGLEHQAGGNVERTQSWYVEAFARMRPHIGEREEEFDVFCSYMENQVAKTNPDAVPSSDGVLQR